MNIWDVLNNEKALIAFASALGAILGGIFTFIGNYFLKKLEIKETRKKASSELNKEVLTKFDSLIGYLSTYKKLLKEKNFSLTSKTAYNQIKFEDITKVAAELALRYGREWSKDFRGLDSKITTAFDSGTIDNDINSKIEKIENELDYFRALQANNLYVGKAKLFFWKLKGKYKLKG